MQVLNRSPIGYGDCGAFSAAVSLLVWSAHFYLVGLVAEPLKNQFGPAIPAQIAGMIARVYPGFPSKPFLETALAGYEALELMPRAAQIARALKQHLPQSFPAAAEILLASLGPKMDVEPSQGMASFRYLPHVIYVGEHGLDSFEDAMRLQYELTQRFTAEFSIRNFLIRHPEATLERLRQWTSDPSDHVRRLVSEGTRPRLPWARRLPTFQTDPSPVLSLLELLKDDESLYVRRSVANNLNDIGKDNPEVLAATARRWLVDADANRRWVVRHALRSALKRGETGALTALGFVAPSAEIRNGSIQPAKAKIGESVVVRFDIVNTASSTQELLVDFRIFFVKASGKASPKVFKMRSVSLAAGEGAHMSKTVSLAEMTTRKHYPGSHVVEALVNGVPMPLGTFQLVG